MDGTLLNRHHRVSDVNRDALLTLAAHGVQIAVCTGRSTGCALPILNSTFPGMRPARCISVIASIPN
jgi:hydroxymethylpyrimidine pyrophosphatase-like HAD family hydrolase